MTWRVAATMTILGLIADWAYLHIDIATRFMLIGEWGFALWWLAMAYVYVWWLATTGWRRVKAVLSQAREVGPVRCAHAGAVPVESAVTEEVLAALCPDCGEHLPAEFLTCQHDNVIEVTNLGEVPGRGICNDCGTSAWFPSELDRRTRVLAKLYGVPYVASLSAPTPAELEIR